MKSLNVFASRFGGKIGLNVEFIVEKSGRFFVLNPFLRKFAKGDFCFAGQYLRGETKRGYSFRVLTF